MSGSNIHVLAELSGYLDGTLSPAETKRIDAHLKSCTGCARHHTELRALRQVLQSGPTYTPPESFYQGVLRRIEKPDSRSAGWNWNWSIKALASACLILIVVWVSHETRKDKAPIMGSQRALTTDTQPTRLADELAAVKPPEAPAAKLRAKDEPPSPVAPSTLSESTGRRPVSPVPQEADAPPLQSLAKRKDIVHQARDTGGAASQNSFTESEKFLGETKKVAAVATASVQRSEAMTADATPALANGSGSLQRGGAIFVPNRPGQLPQWQGDTSGIMNSRTLIVESPEDWQMFWREHTAGSPLPAPEIDFSRTIVVAVYSGQKPSGGYGVEIVEARQTPSALIIEYRETVPPPGTTQTTALTQPYHIKVLPKTSLLIQFKKL